ncbi:hypothetical protein G7Y89_g606 [Cudoniella acicularis]|uniref:AB hydrolase-1 domain-containing protein n=1 Tax=Cudoniella acicularis TaxID=354080 RepID=A0A8H4RWT9_9HELO|nr:hypothetical protein G7Y89_g606 [Cudoniella acicularis]
MRHIQNLQGAISRYNIFINLSFSVEESDINRQRIVTLTAMTALEEPPHNWNTTPFASSLVSIGTHSLHLSICGPPRQTSSQPLIVIFPGAGDIAASWLRVSRLVSSHFRLLLYDRSGFTNSEARPGGPPRQAAVTAAEELRALLKATDLKPPYVLCAHSYGAIIAREFLHLAGEEVVGMVLADGSTERQNLFFKIPDEDANTVCQGVNLARVTGLREDSKLSREEWRERAILISRGADATLEEQSAFNEVCETLREKKQIEKRVLGERPLSVIRCSWKRDFEKMYQAGVEAGNGTVEQRRAVREMLDGWEDIDKDLKEEQLKLSRNSRFVHLPDCGHNVQLLRPDVVAEEIQWVMNSISKEPVALL